MTFKIGDRFTVVAPGTPNEMPLLGCTGRVVGIACMAGHVHGALLQVCLDNDEMIPMRGVRGYNPETHREDALLFYAEELELGTDVRIVE